MRHIERPSIRTQFLIFNLFGDYVYPRDLAVWTSGLLKAMKVLDVSERAVRSTLSRMKHRGWLLSQRRGRKSMYKMSPRGRELLDEGSRRLFGPPPSHWDDNWHLVIYSLPQEMRAVRHQLRTRLSWLGYGMLQPGTMVAAHARAAEVEALIQDLDVEAFVHFFNKAHLAGASDHEIVSRCWDLPGLNLSYTKFIKRYEPFFHYFNQQLERSGKLPNDECFKHRFWATYEFSAFPREDPNLPPELLPADWRGREAAELLVGFRSLLKAPAEEFINETLGIEPVNDPTLEEMTLMPV
jgi:phenylacetic acid degradation operon negative regulatory protein